MKWLKKRGYLFLMLVVGILYFHYVDEWKVYAKTAAPLVQWYDEQSEKYELLANVNDWLADFLGQDEEEPGDINLAGDIDGESNLSGSQVEEEQLGEVGVPENMGETEAAEGTEKAESVDLVQDNENTNAGQESDHDSMDNGEQTGSGMFGGGTHIVIGGPESGAEVEFGDTERVESAEPAWCSVEDFYFEDAVFIGDSRTVGMFEYGGLEEITTFYASKGLSVYDVFDKKIVEVPGQKKKITVEEALQQNSFSKIYLMLGLNEMGTGTTETFLAKYGEVLTHLQELQPNAIIYVQAIMKLTTERSGKGDQFHNPGIEERNAGLSQFADNERIFFLDVNPLICDETGGMIEEYTYDGIHLKAKYMEIWKAYLKEHAILP